MFKLIKKMLLSALIMCAIFSAVACSTEEKDEIKVYTRDTTSGTRDGFFTGIGFSKAKEDNSLLVETYIEVASDGDMINAVKNDEYGIGYISLSSLEKSNLKGLIYEGVEPNEENVLNGSYKLTRRFNYCIRESYNDENVKQIVLAFLAFMNSVEGKSTIKEHGGILVSSSSDKSWNDIKNEYSIVNNDNSEITINVGGSTSVRSIVSNLLIEFSAKCGNFKFNYNPTGSGDAYKRTNGKEKDGASACDLAFASREFNDTEVMDASLFGNMCIDAIVAVVNPKNELTNISMDQLVSIYNGEITKWSLIK